MKTLEDLQPQESQFYLKHPVTKDNLTTDDGESIYWNVVGRDSDEYLGASQKFLQFLEALGDEADNLTSVQYKNQAAIQLSQLVTSWDEKFNDYMGGPCSTKLVEKILCKRNRWIADQLDIYVSVRSNFFTK